MPAGIRHALERTVHDARAQYDRLVAAADKRLEDAEDKHFRAITASHEATTARAQELTEQLGIVEGLENARMAAQIRTELAELDDNHRRVVAEANTDIERAFDDYIRSFASAGTALECSYNAAKARVMSAKVGC